MNRSLFFPLLLATTVLFSSCIKREDVSIKEVENVSMQGFSRIDITLKVENRSGQKVRLEHGRLEVLRGGAPLVDLLLSDEILIPKRSTTSIPVGIRLKLANPIGALALLGDIQGIIPQLTVNGDITVKAGLARKKIHLEGVPFSDFLRTFDTDINQLIESLRP